MTYQVNYTKNMELPRKAAKIAVFAFCSACAALTLAFSVYYLTDYSKNRKKDPNILFPPSKIREEKIAGSFALELELAEILKENGHGEFTKGTISSLLGMLDRVDDSMLEKLLVALLNCSAFTTNQVIKNFVCLVVSRSLQTWMIRDPRQRGRWWLFRTFLECPCKHMKVIVASDNQKEVKAY